MRQLRLMQGKDMERIERVWLVTDDAPLDTMLIREFDGTRMLRAPRAARGQAGCRPEQGATLDDHIYLIDPLGNLMMRFPKDADRSSRQRKPRSRRTSPSCSKRRRSAKRCKLSTLAQLARHRPAGGQPAAGDGLDVVRRQQIPQAGLGRRLFLTFDLIVFGAFTRLTDSGLGCPDWPGCYGQANPFLRA